MHWACKITVKYRKTKAPLFLGALIKYHIFRLLSTKLSPPRLIELKGVTGIVFPGNTLCIPPGVSIEHFIYPSKSDILSTLCPDTHIDPLGGKRNAEEDPHTKITAVLQNKD